jgi:hypothetical protein
MRPGTPFVVNGEFPRARSPAYASPTRTRVHASREIVLNAPQCDSLSALSIHFPESFSSLVQVLLETMRQPPT